YGAIPRGGSLDISLENPETDAKFKIVAKGRMLRVPPKYQEILSGHLEEAVDAHTIQPYYTVLLADECGMELKCVPSEGEIAFTAEVAG
ncbi:MAG: histidine phosphotransferase family protein, partial [Allorhizobium sp.]